MGTEVPELIRTSQFIQAEKWSHEGSQHLKVLRAFVAFFVAVFQKGARKMKRKLFLACLLTCVVATAGSASAHFGMVIPSDQMVMQGENRNVKVDLLFWHPFEDIAMELAKPAKFAVVANSKETDLLASLESIKTKGHQTWTANYKVTRPGVYVFYMEPQPYWEPAEDCFIVHYTKAVMTAFGDDEGWDQELGLKTEIVPLSKPFGLYAGNVFQGIVKINGKPVPFSRVEVEYYNKEGKYSAPTDYMVCQTIKADANGVFTYAAPKAGWWGFAALNTSDEKKTHGGEKKDIELGAVIWVQFHDMQ
jgi:cobalt/nickel transport protein